MSSASQEIISQQPSKSKVHPLEKPEEPAGDDLDLEVDTCNHNNPAAGLQALEPASMLFIKQKPKILEALGVCEMNNNYEILNNFGQKIFSASESTCCLSRNFCGALRPFTIKISDLYNQECLTIDRPFRVYHCCCPSCCHHMTVSNERGMPIGYVSQRCAICRPTFEIQSDNGECLFLVKGPYRCVPYCCSTTFKITSPDGGSIVGKISKKWSGVVKEFFTDADNFGVEFPVHLSVNIKATIMSAVFLIDFMYFEKGE